jgi:hypothetical protein
MKKNDRLLTAIIIIVSVAGIFYFGIRAISDNAKKDTENPYEYNLESYKKKGKQVMHYSELKPIAVPLPKLFALAVGPGDKIYVSGEHSVLVLNPDGSAHSTVKIPATAYCLAVDKNRDLYLGMKDHIEVYNAKGVNKARWESLGERAIITSIALSMKHVFIADAGNFIVWKFDKSGNNPVRIGEKNKAKDIPGFIIPSPYFDVAVDPDGFLWAANTGRHSLENYTGTGGFRSSWGEYSMEPAGFCGCCNPSHFTILDDGSFVTSEKGLARVKVYNRLGQFVSMVAAPDQFKEGTVGLDLATDSARRIYVLDPARKTVRIFIKKSGKI